jgi:hypothetical protein
MPSDEKRTTLDEQLVLKFAHILVILLTATVIQGCSRSTYQDRAMLCKGKIVSRSEKGLEDLGDSFKLGLSIKSDRVSVSGNGIISGERMKGCSPTENPSSKSDEVFFSSSGCGAKEDIGKTYGTFNYLTNELNIYHDLRETQWVQGMFQCDPA